MVTIGYVAAVHFVMKSKIVLILGLSLCPCILTGPLIVRWTCLFSQSTCNGLTWMGPNKLCSRVRDVHVR